MNGLYLAMEYYWGVCHRWNVDYCRWPNKSYNVFSSLITCGIPTMIEIHFYLMSKLYFGTKMDVPKPHGTIILTPTFEWCVVYV